MAAGTSSRFVVVLVCVESSINALSTLRSPVRQPVQRVPIIALLWPSADQHVPNIRDQQSSVMYCATQCETAAMSAAASYIGSATAASLVKGFTSSHYDYVTPLFLSPLSVSLSCALLFFHPLSFSSHCEPSAEWSSGCGRRSGGS